ncbi:IQ motif and ubiquitin-like domain-containing protein [Procambarus clarkii]|uniref:IQ motif and ubiquitin-like domain-containing protein n=1 Tax=Procambarus clarkii TaxID=6728 RepID=UPI0037448E4E
MRSVGGLWTPVMSPYLEDTTHSSDATSSGEAVVAPNTDPHRPRSSPGPRNVAQGPPARTPDDSVVVTDLEHVDGATSPPAGKNHTLHTHGEVEGGRHDGYQWQQEVVATYSNVDDEDPENWWTESGPVATVKLVLETGVGVITRAWPLQQPVHTLKDQLSNITQVPAQFLQLVVRGSVLHDNSTLRSVGVEANETVQVGVSSKRPHTHPLTLLAPTTPSLPTPDVITVIVAEGGGVEREVVVEVEWAAGYKPWLGGYRHKLSGLQYHDAATQTIPPARATPGQVTRSTQTVRACGRGCQTRRAAHTQTTHFHPLLHAPTLVLITPRPYSPTRRYDLAKILAIQRVVRGWLARRRLRALRQARESERVAVEPSETSRSSSVLSDSTTTTEQHKALRPVVPMTDLYARLENWRRTQVSQVNDTLTGKQRRRALVALLEKETELLRSLEAHRALRSARRRNAAVALFLHEVSRAQVWEVGGAVGGGVEVETPDTQPIRILAALASALQQDATTEVRTQQLNQLCQTVEQYYPSRDDGPRTLRAAADLRSLARRGVELLSRGTSDNRLRGLRKRLNSLIIAYLHQVQGRVSSVVAPRYIRAAGAKPVLLPTRMTS